MLKQIACVSLGLSSMAFAAPAVVQPDEAASKDTFFYQAFPTTTPAGLFGMLGSGDPAGDGSRILMVGASAGLHNLRTLLYFDLTGISLAPGEKAVIGVYSRSSAIGFIAGPTTSFPVSVGAFALDAGAWDESTVWNTQPNTLGSALDTETIDGVGKFIEFDVTAQVQTWIDNGLTGYNGFALVQATPVLNSASMTVGAFFDGSGVTTASQRPYLAVVPEPATLGLGALAIVGLGRRRRN